MQRGGKTCQNATVEWVECAKVAKIRLYARTGEENLPNCDCRMLRLSKTSQNETVECCECAKTAKLRPSNAESE